MNFKDILEQIQFELILEGFGMIFGIALLFVSRIQVSQKFKKAMDCFGHLPSLLIRTDTSNFRTCGVEK